MLSCIIVFDLAGTQAPLRNLVENFDLDTKIITPTPIQRRAVDTFPGPKLVTCWNCEQTVWGPGNEVRTLNPSKMMEITCSGLYGC